MILFDRSPGTAAHSPWAAGRLAVLVLAGWASCASGAAAAVDDYLGLPIVEVNFDFGDAEPPPGVEELIVTRVGALLSMADVRDSIWHLFSLDRFSDIRVDASPREAGVALRYELAPVRVVDRIEFRGDLGLSRGRLRDAIAERYGARPQLDQTGDVAELLRGLYGDQGYPNVRITISPIDRGGGLTTLDIEVTAGDRARLATLTIDGRVLQPEPEVFRRVDLRIGGYYAREPLEQRLADYADSLREEGYFEAVVGHAVAVRPSGRQIDLTLRVDPGPRVSLEFEGDALPAEIRETLVPVAREGSVDEDLLEDSSRRLVDYLRQLGFSRAASVGYWQPTHASPTTKSSGSSTTSNAGRACGSAASRSKATRRSRARCSRTGSGSRAATRSWRRRSPRVSPPWSTPTGKLGIRTRAWRRRPSRNPVRPAPVRPCVSVSR